MKICLLTQSLYTLGGVQRAVTEIINSIVGSNNEITVLMPGTNSQVRCFHVDEQIRILDISSIFSMRFEPVYKLLNMLNRRTAFLDNPFGTWYSERHFIRKGELNKLVDWINAEKFDVVIGVADKYSLVVSLIADRIQSKTIGWMHSTFQGYYETRGQNLFGLKKLNARCLRKLDQVCVLTKQDKERFEKEMGVRCTVLYNPVRCENQLQTQEKKYDFIFVGRINRLVKGLDYLTDIMHRTVQQLPDCRLAVVGKGSDEAWMKDRVRQLGIEKNVEFLGLQHDVNQYYRQSKVLLSTSRWEGFGLTLVEAMVYGLPCVAFENNGPCEIIEDGVNGYLVPKYDLQKYAELLVSCIRDQERYQTLSVNAFERAKDFELSSIVEQFMTVLESRHERS